MAALRKAGVARPTPALWAHVRRRSHTHSHPLGSRGIDREIEDRTDTTDHGKPNSLGHTTS